MIKLARIYFFIVVSHKDGGKYCKSITVYFTGKLVSRF